MYNNNVQLNILIRGRPITEYLHNGNIYVEGRDGSTFELEVINQNNFKIEAIVSVDGLSVIDGKAAGEKSSGYLIEANGRMIIPGWKVDDATAAEFIFAGKKASYAAQSSGGDARNAGIIGLMAYREKAPTYVSTRQAFPGISSGMPLFGSTGDGAWMNARSISVSDNLSWSTSDIRGIAPRGSASASLNNVNAMPMQNSTLRSAKTKVAPQAVIQQTLGTGFGDATDFATQEVRFKRGDLLTLFVAYYDDLRGLAARGVPVPRRSYNRDATPNAFPGQPQPTKSCKPPKGWKKKELDFSCLRLR